MHCGFRRPARPLASNDVIAIAEYVAAPVWDIQSRLNFPSAIRSTSAASKERFGPPTSSCARRPPLGGPHARARLADPHRSNVPANCGGSTSASRYRDQQVVDRLQPFLSRASSHTADPAIGTTQRRGAAEGGGLAAADLPEESPCAPQRSPSGIARCERVGASKPKSSGTGADLVPRLALDVGERSEAKTGCSPPGRSRLGAKAVGLRSTLPPPGRSLARERRSGCRSASRSRTRDRPARRRLSARRRPALRHGRTVDRTAIRDPDADRDAQQPRLLERLEPSDRHGAPPRHRRGARPCRSGLV